MSEQKVDLVFKLILIGNSMTGKSSLLHYYLKKHAKLNINQTVGVEFASQLLQFKDKSVKLQIWDTAGQERFRSISKAYYRGVIAAIVVFDLTNEQSFQNLEEWVSEAQTNSKEDLDILIIGNKSDLSEQRAISYQEALNQANNLRCLYIETSAKTGHNVDEALNKLIEHVFVRIEKGKIKYQKQKKGEISADDYKPQLLNPLTKQVTEKKTQNDQKCQYC